MVRDGALALAFHFKSLMAVLPFADSGQRCFVLMEQSARACVACGSVELEAASCGSGYGSGSGFSGIDGHATGCLHKGEWHSKVSDCGPRCGWRLLWNGNLTKQHWGCCASTSEKATGCSIARHQYDEVSAPTGFRHLSSLSGHSQSSSQRVANEGFGLSKKSLAPASKVRSGDGNASLRVDLKELDFGASETVLGTGATSEVLAATFHGTAVAVKRFVHAQRGDGLLLLEKEMATLLMLRHPNIVQCMGAVLTEGMRPCLVLERLDGGSLHDAVHVTRPLLPDVIRFSLVRQIAAALVYLHSRSPAVAHRDVKPMNILLDRRRENAKLTDFGISRAVQTLLSRGPTLNVGTPEYCAPEVFQPGNNNDGSLLTKLDVYSFAVTFWETMAASKPFGECQNAMQIMFSVANGTRPDVTLVPAHLRQLVTQCWHREANLRPSMSQVLSAFEPSVPLGAQNNVEEADEADERQCVVCMERPKSHVLLPCGHLCLCEEDAQVAVSCPLCRLAVSSRHSVFQ